MAKLLRPLRSEKASGVVGDLTYQRYRGHTLARVRRGPDVTDSELQLEAQQRFTEAQQTWQYLTNAQRQAWIAYAPKNQPTDPDYGPKRWSGINAFCSSYCQMSRYYQTPLLLPPSVDRPLPPITAWLDQDFDGIKAKNSGFLNPPGTTNMLELWATGRHSPGRNMGQRMSHFHSYDSATDPAILYVPDANGFFTFYLRHVDIISGLYSTWVKLTIDFTV